MHCTKNFGGSISDAHFGAVSDANCGISVVLLVCYVRIVKGRLTTGKMDCGIGVCDACFVSVGIFKSRRAIAIALILALQPAPITVLA